MSLAKLYFRCVRAKNQTDGQRNWKYLNHITTDNEFAKCSLQSEDMEWLLSDVDIFFEDEMTWF